MNTSLQNFFWWLICTFTLTPESNRERIAFGPLLITVLFLALKKLVFLKKKFFPKKNFFLPFFYATFQCGRYGVFKKILKFFFDPEKVKKQASKVAHNRPRPFFPTVQPRPPPTVQNWFSISWNLGTRHLFSYLWLYSAKSRQELGLGGLASRSSPGRFNYKLIENYYLYLIRTLMIHTFCLKALF